MALLTVSLDMFGSIRELRRLKEPDPAQAAVFAEVAGAHGFSVQLRRDRKAIRDRDLYILREIIKTKLTIETPPLDETIERAIEVKPWMVTLVADHADSGSMVSPIDFGSAAVDFGEITQRLMGAGCNVCFFVEPTLEGIRGAAKAGAAAVTLNCGGFVEARTLDEAQSELDKIDTAAQAGAKAGLSVQAARGLTYKNISPLVELKMIDEFIVGHAITVRALLVGIERAVTEMLALVRPELS